MTPLFLDATFKAALTSLLAIPWNSKKRNQGKVSYNRFEDDKVKQDVHLKGKKNVLLSGACLQSEQLSDWLCVPTAHRMRKLGTDPVVADL